MNGVVWGILGYLAVERALIVYLIRTRHARASIGPESPSTEGKRLALPPGGAGDR